MIFSNRYYTVSEFYREKFGFSVYKLSVNADFTCPNRDGSISDKGCIFCSDKGSGDFCLDSSLDLREQIKNQKNIIQKKKKVNNFICYFQAFTNTYAPVEKLRDIYNEALEIPDVVGLSIATRPDCINDENTRLLKGLMNKTYISVELGLQTIYDRTALWFNRGYSLSVFEDAVSMLSGIGVDIIVHLIIGFPGENLDDMIKTVKYVSSLPVKGVKFHVLHIIRGTLLETEYKKNPFRILTLQEYVEIIATLLTYIRNDIVIHRLTGDPPLDEVIYPDWTKRKLEVINRIRKFMKENNWEQGCNTNL